MQRSGTLSIPGRDLFATSTQDKQIDRVLLKFATGDGLNVSSIGKHDSCDINPEAIREQLRERKCIVQI